MNSSVAFSVVETDRGFDQLQAEWQELFDKSFNPSSSLEYTWLREWWRIFGARGKKLFIVIARSERELVGALPLYTKTTRLGLKKLNFLGIDEAGKGGVYPEYCDMLCEREWAPLLKSKIFDFLNSKDVCSRWDELDLGIVTGDSILHSLTRYYAGSGIIDGSNQQDSYIASLDTGFEGYLIRLSSNRRQRFRRLIKAFEKGGGSFEVAKSASDAGEFLNQLIDLHQKRWGKAGQTGAFKSPELKEFHGRVTERLVPDGRALLSRTSIGGEIQALLYGFVVKNRFEFYQSGVNFESNQSKSPGFLAHLLTMRYLADSRAILEYDFLAGDSDYKKQLSTSSQRLLHQRASRPGLMTQFTRFTHRLEGRFQRIIQSLSV